MKTRKPRRPCPQHPRRGCARNHASCRGCLDKYAKYNAKRHLVGVPLADRVATVYTLSHPRTGIVRYVGSTTLPVSLRMTEHRRLMRGQIKPSSPLSRWLVRLERQGLQPHVGVVVAMPGSRWGRAAEHGHIQFLAGEGRALVNRRRPGVQG